MSHFLSLPRRTQALHRLPCFLLMGAAWVFLALAPANAANPSQPAPPMVAKAQKASKEAKKTPGKAKKTKKDAKTSASKAKKGKSPSAAGGKSARELPVITVVGSKKRARGLPGSASFVEAKEIQKHASDDVAKILKSVPGVFVREEDGNGLLPGISLRGVDSGRSAKVTIMEDGILVAPAPYSSPSAYYTPTVGRMSGLEVLKGSSQIKYGPHTTGGVINYLSTPIPTQYAARVAYHLGSFNENQLHVTVGDSLPRGPNRLGYLVELYHRSSDGFKKLDHTGFLQGSADANTGFSKIEPMLKLSYQWGGKRYQKLDFKWGLSDLKSHETYLGLTTADFRNDSRRRYAASAFDYFPTLHHQVSLKHQIQNSERTDTTTTVYYNKFRRSWFKHDGPINSAAPATLAVIKGLADGTWTYTNNNRLYDAQGAETVVRHAAGKGRTKHGLELGLRYHQDKERRIQNQTVYTISGSSATGQPGPFIAGTVTGAPGSKDNQLRKTTSLALYLQDTIEQGRWKVTPGVRAEWLNMNYADYNKTNPAKPWERAASADFSMLAAGVGATYKVAEKWSLLGGLHQGVSPPGPDGATGGDRARPFTASANLEQEKALSFELGTRYEDAARQLTAEAVFFRTDFNDLVVTGNAGAGGIAGVTFNGGDILTQGLELSLAFDPATAAHRKYKNPWTLALTLTDATIEDSSAVTGGIFSGGKKGAEVPYVPRTQLHLGSEWEWAKWGFSVDASHTSAMWSTAGNTTSATDERIGKTDAYTTLDVSGHVKVGKNQTLSLDLQNLFDKEYIAVRHPLGPRPGKPFTALLGFEWKY